MRKVAFGLSLVMIFMIPWENMIELGISEITGARVIGLAVATSWILSVVVTGRLRKPRPFHVAFYLFVVWNVLSFLWSVNLDRTLEHLLTYFQLVGLVYILWDLYATPAALKAGLQAYVLGAYVSIVSTVLNYLEGNEYYYLRYAATGFDTNDLGIVLALGIPIAWYLAVPRSSGEGMDLLRVVNYAYIPAALLAIVLTASRASFIAASLALLFILATPGRLKFAARASIFIFIVGVLFALEPLIPQSSLERFATIGASIAAADLGGRVDIWRHGIGVFLDHPILGVGSGAFRSAVETGEFAHNAFLDILVGVGLIGFLLFMVILLIVVRQAIRQPKWDAGFWLAILAVWSIGAFSLSWDVRKQTWLFMSLVIVSASLFVQRDRSRLSVNRSVVARSSLQG